MPMKKPSKPSARMNASRNRDYASNAKKPAPFGRYEDKSPVPAKRASKAAVKKAGAEGPKKSVKAEYSRTWRPVSKSSEGPKKSMPRKKMK